MRKVIMITAALLFWAATVQAEEVTCKGDITSVQGGLVSRTYRFDVPSVNGGDMMAILEQCKKMAQERQNRAARKNPGGKFRKFSYIDLNCAKGSQKFQIRQTLETGS